MDLKSRIVDIKTSGKEIEICFRANSISFESIRELIGQDLSLSIEKYKEKRSIDANAYMWTLLQRMASILDTTKDELYIQMLDRYGVFTHIAVKPHLVKEIQKEWRVVRELGEIEVEGETRMQLQCFIGSSAYNTEEMSVLIDGIVSDCKDLDIDILPLQAIDRMKKEWGQ